MTTLSPEFLNVKLFHISPLYRKAEFMNVPLALYLTIALEPSLDAGKLTPLMRSVSPYVRWIRLAASLFAPIAAYPLCVLLRPLAVPKNVSAEIPMVSIMFVITASHVITMSPVTLAIVIVLPDTAEEDISTPPISTITDVSTFPLSGVSVAV